MQLHEEAIMTPYPVIVEWTDACATEGPFGLDESGFAGLVTYSAGFLVEKNTNSVTLAQDIHIQNPKRSDTIRQVITIPMPMVRRIYKLKRR
jgi:hypothetical protein